MRTGKTTRVTFSADGSAIDIALPSCWTDLSQEELRRIYEVVATVDRDKATRLFAAFRALTGARVEARFEGRFLLRFKSGKHTRRVWVTPEDMAEHLEALAWINDPGEVPVRLERWGAPKSPRGVDPCLHGVSFGDYLKLENLYQGFLSSGSPDALLSMAKLLYPGLVPRRPPSDAQILNVLSWVIQVKSLFSRSFPNFFKPAASNGSAPSMLEVMNNEIRALTGGDVTKEDVIFRTDCWRALTELDFKAREAEEFNRQMAKSKKS
ncbi:MAG: hypothetical protein K2G30_10130 [Muribaculaceae bacterium]|nr:hypothetical protein [Muribaculaceae bacterium]